MTAKFVTFFISNFREGYEYPAPSSEVKRQVWSIRIKVNDKLS